MNWSEILSDFEPDGSLRDLYVLRTTLVDWQRVLDLLAAWRPAPILRLGGEPAPVPDRIEPIFAAARARGALMSLQVGNASLNCHFFAEDQIEFDLDPREVTEPPHVEALIHFMALVGEATNKAVLLTMENVPEAVILCYSPERKAAEWIGPPHR